MRANLQPIRTLIIDEHPVIRRGLRMVLDAQTDFQVTSEAGSVAEALHQSLDLQPDIILVHLNLPDPQRPEFYRQLQEMCPRARVIVFSDDHSPLQVAQALNAGVVGYVCKDVDASNFADILRRIAGGERYLESSLARQLQTASPGATPVVPTPVLTAANLRC